MQPHPQSTTGKAPGPGQRDTTPLSAASTLDQTHGAGTGTGTPYGPLLQKGVTSYCFSYEGYYNGYIDKILIRYSASSTPLYPEPFKGGGIKSLKVLRIMPNEDKDPYDKAFYQNLKEKYGIEPPQL